MVIDLIDIINQKTTYGGSLDYPIDNVSGYTINQIEDALKGAKTLQKWNEDLKSMYDNTTEENLDELFSNYINMK